MSLRAAAWLGGAIELAALAVVGLLFVIGESLAAIKVLLYALFVPGLGIFAIVTVGTLRRPNWYRKPENVGGVMFVIGCFLVLGPILAYAPWTPERFPLGQMPFGLPILVWAGTGFLVGGSILGLVTSVIAFWRERDWLRVLGAIIVLVLVGFVIVRIVATRTGGG